MSIELKVLRSRQYLISALISITFCLAGTQVLFYYLQIGQAELRAHSVHSVLRQETSASNSFLLSRSLIDLQKMGSFDCLTLTRAGANTPTLDLRYNGHCEVKSVFLEGFKLSRQMEGLNGLTWDVTFVHRNDHFFILSLWLTRTLVALLALLSLFAFWRWNFLNESKLKIKTLENKELQNLVQTKEQEAMKARIESQYRARLSNLARKVAHDIRSPLSVISLLSTKLTHHSPDEGQLLQEASSRILATAENLLRISRESNEENPTQQVQSATLGSRQKVRLQKFGAAHLVSLCEKLVRHKRLEYSHKSFATLTLESELIGNPLILFDPVEMESILSNLVNNSFDSLTRNGFIRLHLHEISESVVLEVRDSGCGVPPHILQKLGKEPLTSAKPTGNGLGLYQAYNSLLQWGAKLEVHSPSQRGTIVKITFPSVKSATYSNNQSASIFQHSVTN